MKFRQTRTIGTESDEKQLEDEIRRLARSQSDPRAPSDPYWTNLLIRTNQKIDEATSGKALSLSWAYRVAIPGVLAIFSFFIGLHYYGPEPALPKSSLEAVVLSLPSQAADSLIVHPERVDLSLSVEDVIGTDPLEVAKDEVADYFIDRGRSTALMESMSEDQVNDVLAVLGSAPKGRD